MRSATRTPTAQLAFDPWITMLVHYVQMNASPSQRGGPAGLRSSISPRQLIGTPLAQMWPMTKSTQGYGAMRIEQLMSRPVHTCQSGDVLSVPAQQMWDYDVGAVPVVDEQGRLVGIVTDRDICMAALLQGKPLHAIPVALVMARNVFTCDGDDTVEAAEQLMKLKQVRRVPVVTDGDTPIGILSLNDIARDAGSSSKKNGVYGQVVQTLAAICEPRAHALRSV